MSDKYVCVHCKRGQCRCDGNPFSPYRWNEMRKRDNLQEKFRTIAENLSDAAASMVFALTSVGKALNQFSTVIDDYRPNDELNQIIANEPDEYNRAFYRDNYFDLSNILVLYGFDGSEDETDAT